LQSPVFSPDATKLAYIELRKGAEPRLCVASLDTGPIWRFPEHLTESASAQSKFTLSLEQPFFSPDGQKIFFVMSATDYQCRSLFSSNFDGTGLHRLSSCDSSPVNPILSPDGQHIAFSSLSGFHINVIDLQGKAISTFPYDVQETVQSKFTFFPDGQKILYVPNHAIEEKFYIYIQDLTTGTRVKVTELQKEPYPARFPMASISPNNRSVVFTAPTGAITAANGKYKAEQYEVFIIDIQNRRAERLTNDNNFDTQPVFTTDGSKIIFASYGGNQSGIYMMDVDGRNRRMILSLHGTADKVNQFALSPDGQRIAVQDYSPINQENIFLLNVDGTGLTRLKHVTTPYLASQQRRATDDGSTTSLQKNSLPIAHVDQRHTRGGTKRANVIAEIRRVDFRNFTYPLSHSDAEILKMQTVKVRGGKYDNGKSDESWQAFNVKKILYGDLTGDGQAEALIMTTTEWVGANPANSISQGIYVYTIENGMPTALMTPDGLDYWRDYSRYENSNDPCDGWVWGITPKTISNLIFTLELAVAGRHCVNKGYKVTMRYRWNNGHMGLGGIPLKRRVIAPDIR
jgi:Tol biopolymer transport system component